METKAPMGCILPTQPFINRLADLLKARRFDESVPNETLTPAEHACIESLEDVHGCFHLKQKQ